MASVVVIIVTYKSAQLTIDALQSLCAERPGRGFSVRAIVVDNASGISRVTEAVANRHWQDWVTLVAAPKNGGFAYGNNLGIESASVR